VLRVNFIYFCRTVTVYYKFVINCKMHYKCAYCKKGFIKVNLLMKHLDLHNNINKYRCIQDGCCREFRHKFSFVRHIKSHKFACEKKAFCNSHSKSKIKNDKNSDSSSSNDFQNFENIELFSDLNGNISETLSLENYKLDITNNLLAFVTKINKSSVSRKIIQEFFMYLSTFSSDLLGEVYKKNLVLKFQMKSSPIS